MGLGRILGGALAGYGAGQAEVARSAEEERRAIALENLRSQNQRDETTHTGNVNDRNDARATVRRTDADLIKMGVGAEIDTTKATRDRSWDVEDREDAQAHDVGLVQTRQAHDVTMANINANIDRTTAEYKKSLESGDVDEYLIDGTTGEYVAITKGKKRVRTGIIATDREINGSSGNSAGSSALADVRAAAGGGLGRPAAAPARSAPAPATRPAPAQTAQKPSGQATYTQADAVATAQQYGIPVSQVHAMMRGKGYKLTGK